MKSRVSLAFLILAFAAGSATGFDHGTLDADQRKALAAGETIILAARPDEESEPDTRFVTIAKLVEGDRATIWEVIHDKENAEHFLDGVLESREISRTEDEIVVEQKTHVGGPKGAYRYVLRHKLTPMESSTFTYESGEIRNVEGTWWIFDGPTPDRFLVVYSLHIDPGRFAPQFVVKGGMKKSIPGTFRCVQREVSRRLAEE